jgi:hypothetical protein
MVTDVAGPICLLRVNSDRARSAPAAPDDRNSLQADVISLSSAAQVSPPPVEVQPGARPTRRAREQVLALVAK